MCSSGDSSQEGLNVDLGYGLEGDGSASGTGMLVFPFSFDKLVCFNHYINILYMGYMGNLLPFY